jgi:hypothetical protein
MSLISILLVLIVIGTVLWLINTYVPMDTTVKNIFNSLIVIVTIIWILNAFGLSVLKSIDAIVKKTDYQIYKSKIKL